MHIDVCSNVFVRDYVAACARRVASQACVHIHIRESHVLVCNVYVVPALLWTHKVVRLSGEKMFLNTHTSTFTYDHSRTPCQYICMYILLCSFLIAIQLECFTKQPYMTPKLSFSVRRCAYLCCSVMSSNVLVGASSIIVVIQSMFPHQRMWTMCLFNAGMLFSWIQFLIVWLFEQSKTLSTMRVRLKNIVQANSCAYRAWSCESIETDYSHVLEIVLLVWTRVWVILSVCLRLRLSQWFAQICTENTFSSSSEHIKNTRTKAISYITWTCICTADSCFFLFLRSWMHHRWRRCWRFQHIRHTRWCSVHSSQQKNYSRMSFLIRDIIITNILDIILNLIRCDI